MTTTTFDNVPARRNVPSIRIKPAPRFAAKRPTAAAQATIERLASGNSGRLPEAPPPKVDMRGLEPLSMVTEKVAAEFLSVTVRTLQKWRGTGEGPPFSRLSARAIRYCVQDLVDWVLSRVCRSTSEYDR